ncbi:hypothetical protein TWF730_009170 [Orbilia blumenaviensis]|uniref:Uncharacterized protein n=1 Tax=Orbilia blumenaviensis TaxID=1796055 RepID=A0AAV9V0M3_9PEZI
MGQSYQKSLYIRLFLLQLFATQRAYGQSTRLLTSSATDVILTTTETVVGTVTVNCNGVPIGTAFASDSDTNTESSDIPTETVIETVVAGGRTRTQTILSITTITDTVTTTISVATTDIPISAGVPFAINIFGGDDVALAAIVDGAGAVNLVDATTAIDATPVYIDDSGLIRLLNSQDEVLYFADLTFPRLFRRQSITGKALVKPAAQLSATDTSGNFSASGSALALRRNSIGIGFFFDNPSSGAGRGLYGVPNGQTPNSSLTSGTVKGSVISTSVSATKGISSTASSTAANSTGIDAIVTSYSSFCQAYLSLGPTTTQGSTTTVPSTTLISTNISNTTVSSPGPLETTKTETPETTVSTTGTFETWPTAPSGERRRRQTSSTSSSSQTSSTSTSTSSTLSTPEALQPYASDVISSACRAKITYTLISTSPIYISEGAETSTTEVGETSTIYGPPSSTITETVGGTTVPVTATITAKTIAQPSPSAICRIGVGSNICWELQYTQTSNTSTDPLRIWIADTSRDLIADIPLFTIDEYGRLTYTHPATQIKLHAALPKGDPTAANPLTFVTPQYKVANNFGWVKWFWDSSNNDKLILDPNNDDIANAGQTSPVAIGECFYQSPVPSPAPQYGYLAIGAAGSYNIDTLVTNCYLGRTVGFRA